MDIQQAIASFAALSQETRLKAFQLLVRAEPEGLAAGEIARRLSVPHNTLSAHLAVLSQAGWVVSQRHSRSIVYRANLSQVNATIQFLVRDCCAGHPEIRQPLQTGPGACTNFDPPEVPEALKLPKSSDSSDSADPSDPSDPEAPGC